MLVSMRYPHWVGVIGLLDGLGMAAAGGAQASSGFSALAMTISMTASSVLLLWIILAGDSHVAAGASVGEQCRRTRIQLPWLN
jgi:hypothetical protein